MYKLGRIRNPFLVVLLTIVTGGIYGIVWFYIVLEELRKYRSTGIPGWVFLVSLGGSIFLYFLILPFLIFMIILSFLIPSSIDHEREKLGQSKKKLTLLGLFPALTPVILYGTFFFAFFVPIPQTSGIWISQFAFVGLLVLLNMVWVYFIQKNLNILWELAANTFEFAKPVFDGQTEEYYGDEEDPNRYAPAPYESYNDDFEVATDESNIVLNDEEFIPIENDEDKNNQNTE